MKNDNNKKGRRPQKKWKTTLKIKDGKLPPKKMKMGDDQNKKMEDDLKNNY
jgi:hypothetical protein